MIRRLKTRDEAAVPPGLPRQPYRPAQANIPNEKSERDRLRSLARRRVEQMNLVPPLAGDQLRRQAEQLCKLAGVDRIYRDYAAVLVNNETWRDTLARIPYRRRLLLLPQCLRAEGRCPAPIDELGLVCQECGQCPLHHLQAEAERLGYAVLIAEGATVVAKMIETGQIEAVVGVSCMSVLEKCFPHVEARAVPGIAIPLLQEGCANTSVDLDWVRDAVHLTSEDQTYRLDLDALKRQVQSWFTRESLSAVVGAAEGETEAIAHDWLSRAGKRWRPYLTTCVYMSLQSHASGRPALLKDADRTRGAADFSPRGAAQAEACGSSTDPAQAEACGSSTDPVQAEACGSSPKGLLDALTDDLKKLAIAVECFLKASLIHDDIEDGDHQRYGQKTLHIEHGTPVALNVGDFLLGEGYRLIGELDVDDRTSVAMLRTAAAGHLTLSRGQGAELCWARQPKPLAASEVLDIFRQKTAPAFEVALRLGAFYGGADERVHDALTRYSEALGIAYQIRDDLEDFAGLGDSHDSRGLRPSLILAIAHKRAGEDAEKQLTSSLWSRTCRCDDVASQIQRLIARRAVIETVESLLDAYTAQATRSLHPLASPTLKGLLRRVIGRIFGGEPIRGYCREFEARHATGRSLGPGPAA